MTSNHSHTDPFGSEAVNPSTDLPDQRYLTQPFIRSYTNPQPHVHVTPTEWQRDPNDFEAVIPSPDLTDQRTLSQPINWSSTNHQPHVHVTPTEWQDNPNDFAAVIPSTVLPQPINRASTSYQTHVRGTPTSWQHDAYGNMQHAIHRYENYSRIHSSAPLSGTQAFTGNNQLFCPNAAFVQRNPHQAPLSPSNHHYMNQYPSAQLHSSNISYTPPQPSGFIQQPTASQIMHANLRSHTMSPLTLASPSQFPTSTALVVTNASPIRHPGEQSSNHSERSSRPNRYGGPQMRSTIHEQLSRVAAFDVAVNEVLEHREMNFQSIPIVESDEQRHPVHLELIHKDKWDELFPHTAEMITTNSGRRIFPPLSVRISGLEAGSMYTIVIDLIQLYPHSLRYEQGRWEPSGSSRQYPPPERTQPLFYVPQHSPLSGEQLRSEGIDLKPAKIVHSRTASQHQNMMFVYSQHMYIPRYHIFRHLPEGANSATDNGATAGPQSVEPVGSYIIPGTQFMAVTVYQNPEVNRLKTRQNPYSRGVRRRSEYQT